jgi:hypothetical protein
MSRRAYGLPTRTRRAHPSDKNAARVISGLSPQGHLALDSPPLGGAGSARPRRHHRSTQACFRLAICLGLAPLGGAGSARPQGRHNANSTVASSWPPGHRQRMWRKWNASAHIRPPHADAQSASLRENRLSRHLGAFPARPSQLGSPIRRRGGLRTPAKMAMPSPKDYPLGPPGVLCPDDYVIPRLASGPYSRTRRAHPSEKITFRAIPGLAKQGPLSSLGRLAEGRAPHARKEGFGWTEACPLLATGCWFAFDHHALPRVYIRPCHPGAKTAPLEENRRLAFSRGLRPRAVFMDCIRPPFSHPRGAFLQKKRRPLEWADISARDRHTPRARPSQ